MGVLSTAREKQAEKELLQSSLLDTPQPESPKEALKLKTVWSTCLERDVCMIVSRTQLERFYSTWWELLKHVNNISGLGFAVPETIVVGEAPIEVSMELRTELWLHPDYLTSFVEENPGNLSSSDLEIVTSWVGATEQEYFIFRHLKNHTIFLTTDDEHPRAFAVKGLLSPLEEMFPVLPVYVQAVLLPFEDVIIYDSFLAPFSVSFGGGIKRSLKEAYNAAKNSEGIVKSLPVAV